MGAPRKFDEETRERAVRIPVRSSAKWCKRLMRADSRWDGLQLDYGEGRCHLDGIVHQRVGE